MTRKKAVHLNGKNRNGNEFQTRVFKEVLELPKYQRGTWLAQSSNLETLFPGQRQIVTPPGESGQADRSLRIVIVGPSITSSWGNGHARTYRSLARELNARGHDILFLERNAEWHASNRDLPEPPYCRVSLYETLKEIKDRHAGEIRDADLVIVGSGVQQGAVVGEWVTKQAQGVTAFYDLDTPVTIARLEEKDLDYLTRSLIPKYQMYLSCTGGRVLDRLERVFNSPMARPLHCSVDTTLYYPEPTRLRWDLGYMGTYTDDRQPALDELLMEPARNWDDGKFTVAGPQYPRCIRWPRNIRRFTHLAPDKHRAFYNAQRYTLNITPADMVEAGYSPSVRLLEAAACGTPIITDFWDGLDQFFQPGKEILVANSSEESLYYLVALSDAERRQIGEAARARVLRKHTAKHRARELEKYVFELLKPSIPAYP